MDIDENNESFKNFKKGFEKNREAGMLMEDIINKSVTFDKKTLKTFLRIYSDLPNTYWDTKYGSEPLKVFLSEYPFKSMYDYKDVLRALKEQAYFDSGSTFYAHFNDVITNSLFHSSYIKLEWIIEHMALNGSFAEINNVVRFIFTKDNVSIIKFLNQIIDHVSGFKKDVVVYEAIIRYALNREIDGLENVLKHIFLLDTKIEIVSITAAYPLIASEAVKLVVGEYLFKKTKNTKYLPQEAQDIFVF